MVNRRGCCDQNFPRITLYKYCRHVSSLLPSLPTVNVSEVSCTDRLYTQTRCLHFGGKVRHSSSATEKNVAVSCEKLVTALQSTGWYKQEHTNPIFHLY